MELKRRALLLRLLFQVSRAPLYSDFQFFAFSFSLYFIWRRHITGNIAKLFLAKHIDRLSLYLTLSFGSGQWNDSVFFLDLSQKLMKSAHPVPFVRLIKVKLPSWIHPVDVRKKVTSKMWWISFFLVSLASPGRGVASVCSTPARFLEEDRNFFSISSFPRNALTKNYW